LGTVHSNTSFPVTRESAIRFIVTLGTISLLADVTYEGARSINGPFLGTLGASAAVVGIVSGAGELIGYVLRLAGGVAADKTRRYWTLTVVGYVINLLVVPFMALAHHWGIAAALIIAERAGKGLRTPARDVMLSQASKIVGRGWGFGLHEFMDQMGAFLGPLFVALVVKETQHYTRAYALLGIPAGLAILALVRAIKLYPDPSRFEEPITSEMRAAGLPREFWIYLIAAGLIAAGFVDLPLIAFHFQKANVVSPPLIPVLYAIAMGVEGLSALLAGKLFDRMGTPVLITGVLLAAASNPLVFFGSFYAAVAGMALWGAGMGALQSTLRARISDLVPTERRGAAYGIFNTAYGVLWFAGSSTVGILYGWSLVAAVAFAIVAQLSAIPFLLIARRRPA
jgi:predicted MFS family arabinose efflux permease